MMWTIVSLITLVLVVVIANKRNINIGLVGLAAAMLVGTLAGLPCKKILSGFNVTLFLRTLGIQSLICVAKYNGTLEALSKRIIKVGCGRAMRFLPVFLFVAILLCEYAGTGVFNLVLPILCALGFELGMPVLKVAAIGLLTMLGGGLSPFAPPGVTLSTLAGEAGCSINQWNTAISGTIVASILFVIFYFAFGWHKEKPRTMAEVSIAPLNWQQKATLLGYAVFVFANIVLGIDLTITPIIIAMFLCIVGAGDGTQLIKRLPWNAMVMVGGMTVMVGVVSELGGVGLISQGLALVANKWTAPGLMTGLAGLTSVISSASGVVMPTFVPTVPGIAELIPGVSVQGLVSSIGLGSYATSFSPMSTVGANVLANYGTVYAPSPEEEKKVFNQLLLFALIGWTAYTLAGLCGLYNIQFFH